MIYLHINIVCSQSKTWQKIHTHTPICIQYIAKCHCQTVFGGVGFPTFPRLSRNVETPEPGSEFHFVLYRDAKAAMHRGMFSYVNQWCTGLSTRPKSTGTDAFQNLNNLIEVKWEIFFERVGGFMPYSVSFYVSHFCSIPPEVVNTGHTAMPFLPCQLASSFGSDWRQGFHVEPLQ